MLSETKGNVTSVGVVVMQLTMGNFALCDMVLRWYCHFHSPGCLSTPTATATATITQTTATANTDTNAVQAKLETQLAAC